MLNLLLFLPECLVQTVNTCEFGLLHCGIAYPHWMILLRATIALVRIGIVV